MKQGKTYKAVMDAGHGWVKVPYTDLVALGIENDISSYSYMTQTSVWLEEDCDWSKFYDAYKAKFGEDMKYEVSNVDHSAVRNLPGYRQKLMEYPFKTGDWVRVKGAQPLVLTEWHKPGEFLLRNRDGASIYRATQRQLNVSAIGREASYDLALRNDRIYRQLATVTSLAKESGTEEDWAVYRICGVFAGMVSESINACDPHGGGKVYDQGGILAAVTRNASDDIWREAIRNIAVLVEPLVRHDLVLDGVAPAGGIAVPIMDLWRDAIPGSARADIESLIGIPVEACVLAGDGRKKPKMYS